MNNKLLVLLLSIFTASTLSVKAYDKEGTFSFGARVGGVLADPYFKAGKKFYGDTQYKAGFMAGLVVKYYLPQSFYLQSGIDYKLQGYKLKDIVVTTNGNGEATSSGLRATPQYLNVPIHIGYRLPLQDFYLNFSWGPYFAYGIAGKIGGMGENKEIQEDYFSKSTFKRFDMGLGAKVGAEYDIMEVMLGFDFGLVNVDRDMRNSAAQQKYKRNSLKNRSVYFALGVNF